MREDILRTIEEANDRRVVQHPVPKWGVVLFLHEPVMGDVQELREKYLAIGKDGKMDVSKSDLDSFNYGLIALTVHTEEGERLFSGVQEARKLLNKKASAAINDLVEACGKLAGAKEDALEEAEGN